jgi:nucleotide-binding universal stress UspA family protein
MIVRLRLPSAPRTAPLLVAIFAFLCRQTMARNMKLPRLMAEQARIVVGANLSEHSDEAVRQGAEWARAHGWQMIVCHVAPQIEYDLSSRPSRLAEERRAQSELDQKRGQALGAHIGELTGQAIAEKDLIVVAGNPKAELIRVAHERSARLLVIGSHSHSGLRYIFLGEVAEHIAHQADCSVLVARPHPKTRRILVAADFSADSAAAIASAAEHARLIDARLTVACSVERQMEPVRRLTNFGAGYGFLQSEYEDLRRTAENRLEAELARINVRAATMVLDGKLAPAILQAAGERDADLVVIGASGGSRIKRALLGDVAERVIRAAPCSVLVSRVPPPA